MGNSGYCFQKVARANQRCRCCILHLSRKNKREAQSTLAGLRKRDIGGSDEGVAPNRVSIE